MEHWNEEAGQAWLRRILDYFQGRVAQRFRSRVGLHPINHPDPARRSASACIRSISKMRPASFAERTGAARMKPWHRSTPAQALRRADLLHPRGGDKLIVDDHAKCMRVQLAPSDTVDVPSRPAL